MRLDVQQLQRCHSRFPRHVLQDLKSWAAVLIELGADVEQRFAGSPKLFACDALIHLFPWHSLPLLQQVQVVPACRPGARGLVHGKVRSRTQWLLLLTCSEVYGRGSTDIISKIYKHPLIPQEQCIPR